MCVCVYVSFCLSVGAHLFEVHVLNKDVFSITKQQEVPKEFNSNNVLGMCKKVSDIFFV